MYNRAMPYVSAAVNTALRYRNSGTQTQTQRGRTAERGNITFQNDEALLYRRKSAPRKVRRRQRRAFNSLMYRMDKLQSMKTALINWYSAPAAVPTSWLNGQAVTSVSLYGYGANTFAANTNEGNGDMWYIFSRENGGDPTAALATRKLRFRSAVLDVTVKNVLAGTGEGDEGGLLILDVYHYVARKNVSNQFVTTGDAASFWNACINDQAPGNMPVAITDNLVYGVTPFDASGFGRFVKILKKRRIKLSPGQVYNTQIRDPGNYILRMDDVFNFRMKGGLTEGLIFVGYNPGMISSEIPGNVNYECVATKTYHYTELSSSVDAIGEGV